MVMKGFKSKIEHDTVTNINFRKVLYTGNHMQLVLMSLKPGEEIGMEIHKDNDQFFRFEAGHGRCLIDDHEYEVTDGDAIVIPCGAKHNIINLSNDHDLKMYTIYAPPHHKDGIVRVSKEEAVQNEADFNGETTE